MPLINTIFRFKERPKTESCEVDWGWKRPLAVGSWEQRISAPGTAPRGPPGAAPSPPRGPLDPSPPKSHSSNGKRRQRWRQQKGGSKYPLQILTWPAKHIVIIIFFKNGRQKYFTIHQKQKRRTNCHCNNEFWQNNIQPFEGFKSYDQQRWKWSGKERESN